MPGRRYFGQRVKVDCAPGDAGLHLPERIVMGQEEIRVAEVLRQWHDHGHPSTSPRKSWLDRKHRTCYRVRAVDGRVCEIYVDRTGGRRDWFLTKVETPAGAAPSRRRRASQG